MKRNFAFTLAEVLITLAIIGVVAALTMPALITGYKEKAAVTKVKRTYSIINSAYKMALANYGEFNTWGWQGISEYEIDEDGNTHYSDTALQNMEIFWEKLSENLKIVEKCMPGQNNCYRPEALYYLNGTKANVDRKNVPYLTLNDGVTLFGGWISQTSCRNKNDICADFGIDINGIRNMPNTIGKDRFYFYVSPDRIIPVGLPTDKNYLFDTNCKLTSTEAHSGYSCTAWVIEKSNMDYLHCNDLSWTGKQKCNESE